MKTLGEVIEAQKRCETYPNCHFCYLHSGPMCEWIRDALHYLKEYRDECNNIINVHDDYIHLRNEMRNKYRVTSQKLRNTSQITCPKCHSKFVILDDPDGDHAQSLKCRALLQDFYRNDPLTWDELKQMEGKPVWVEMDGYAPAWGIIMNQDKRNGRLCLCGYDKVPIRIEINEDGEGKTWRAYRKERK